MPLDRDPEIRSWTCCTEGHAGPLCNWDTRYEHLVCTVDNHRANYRYDDICQVWFRTSNRSKRGGSDARPCVAHAAKGNGKGKQQQQQQPAPPVAKHFAATPAPAVRTTQPQPATATPPTTPRIAPSSSAKRTLPESAPQDPVTLAASSADVTWPPSLPPRQPEGAASSAGSEEPTRTVRREYPRPCIPIPGPNPSDWPTIETALARPAPGTKAARPRVHFTTFVDLTGAERDTPERLSEESPP